MPVVPSGTPNGGQPVAPMGNEPCGWAIDPTLCCPDWTAYSDELKDKAIRYATTIMWAATGRRYGTCSNTVRPCGNDRRCGECGSWAWTSSGLLRPYILNGLWRNCGCGCPCDCRPRCEVKLPGPIDTIGEVMIDGVILSSTSYRVDDEQWLVRTDGECWPRCQDYNVDVPDAGTFQVTYLRGQMIPMVVLDASATLACEFAKLCSGQACRLPGRMSNLTRQGVSVTFTDVDLLLKRGLTGIPEVDQVIVAENPYALKARPFFYSFDTSPRLRTVTS